MKIVRYTPAFQTQWDSFVATAKNGHFMHQRGYMEYHSDRFADHSLMIFDTSETLWGLFPACASEKVLHSHQGLTFGGMILSDDARAHEVLAAYEALRVYAQNCGFREIVVKQIPHLYHRQPCEEELYALFRLDAVPVRTDITTTVNLRQPLAFSSLRKRGAKKAHKAGVTLQPSSDYAAFHKILRDIVEGKYEAHVTHSQAEIQLLAERFPQNIHLHAAYLNETMLAGVLIFETDTVAHAQYIGANDLGRELGALDALFSQLIAQTYAQKHYFDFGISTEQAGRYLNANLIAQKEGFGGRGLVHQFFRLVV